ncbi:MAG: 3'-5' exoribonuclease [Bacteroidaceae bacterium]|nr:3'-5' exoribonuclease [Prevotella sp.]MBP5770247.1 3'-5' exoribonuclease [Bacteroidaceae bacterium]
MDFVAIDFEKLNDSQLSVCEVGLVAFKNGKEVEYYHSYINPVGGLERNDWARKNLLHISDKMLLEAPSYNNVFHDMRNLIQGKILVVHSKGADLNYIYRLEEHFNLPKLYSKWVDTRDIARSVGADESLPGLYLQCFETILSEHHNALEDARACGHIFEFISSQSQFDVRHFIHEEEYLPSKEKSYCDSLTSRHTQFGTANVAVDGLVFNHNKITSCSYFKGKTVVLSGMNHNDKNRIKSILDSIGAKCTSSFSQKTNIFITSRVVGPSKKMQAIQLQKETGLLVITDEYFWKLVR